MAYLISKNINNLGKKIGWFLTNFFYVFLTLFAYVILYILTFLLLGSSLNDYNKASLITFYIATGSDPYNFQGTFAEHFWLWQWLLILHILSWLVVPVLAGTAISASFIAWEKEKEEKEELLNLILNQLIRKHLGKSSDEAEQITLQIQRDIRLEILSLKREAKD